METNYDEYKPKIKFKKRFIFLILGSILLFAIIAFCVYDILIAKGDKLLLPTGIAKTLMFTSGILLVAILIIYLISLNSIVEARPGNEELENAFGEVEKEEKKRYAVNSVDDQVLNYRLREAEYTKNKPRVIPISKESLRGAVSHLPSKVKSQINSFDITVNDEKAKETGKSRFANLTRLDNYFANEFVEPTYNDSISLKDYCEAFRNFSAYSLHLYYDIKDIRRFIAGLAVTKLLILQGMSGTGKTSLALAFGRFLDNTTTVIPIQPMWKERTDLIGYYNEFTKEFNETDLLNKMYEANYNNQIYITVLDEMNIARVEYYFAEFLSLLELPNPEERNLVIVSSRWDNDPKKIDKEGKLRMPLNMWFIGTANNDDSTFAISDKVYDRAMILNLDTKAEVFEGKDTGSIRVSSDYYYKKVDEALLEYSLSERNRRRIKKFDEYLVEKFHITFGNRIMKQINVYVPVLVACGGTELEGLDDILSRKVLRKLESKNPVYVKSQAEALCNKIDEIFGTDKMPLCKQTIINIEQNS